MQQFDINDAFGNRIGSVTPAPSFVDGFKQGYQSSRGSDAISAYMNAQTEAKAERIIQIIDFVNRITGDISAYLDEFDEIHNGPSGIDVTNAEARLNEIASKWESAVEVMSDLRIKTNPRKMEKHLERELMPLLLEVDPAMQEAGEYIQFFRGLEQLLSVANALLFEKANSAVDRLDARGFFDLSVTDPIFLNIQSKYDKAMDEVIQFHTEIEEIISLVNAEFNFDNLLIRFQEVGSRSDSIQKSLNDFSLLIDSREEMALKLMETQLQNGSKSDLSTSLSNLASMFGEGLLTKEEFEAAKKKLLN